MIIARNISLKLFKIVQSIVKNGNQVIYHSFIIWFCEKATWYKKILKPSLIIQYLKMNIGLFYKKYLNMPITIFFVINKFLPIAKSVFKAIKSTKLTTRQNFSCLNKNKANK